MCYVGTVIMLGTYCGLFLINEWKAEYACFKASILIIISTISLILGIVIGVISSNFLIITDIFGIISCITAVLAFNVEDENQKLKQFGKED